MRCLSPRYTNSSILEESANHRHLMITDLSISRSAEVCWRLP